MIKLKMSEPPYRNICRKISYNCQCHEGEDAELMKRMERLVENGMQGFERGVKLRREKLIKGERY